MTTNGVWPNDVIDHAVNRSLIVVVGAGISANSVNDENSRPPGWSDLLRISATRIGMDGRLRELEALLGQERLLDAAELLKFDAAARSRTQDLHQVIAEAVDGPRGHPFLGNQWHDAIVSLEPSVIITTNFDRIIERATLSGYNTHSYTSLKLAADIRRNAAVLLKIHGTVDEVEGLILSKQDFVRVRKSRAHVFEVLHALFLTRPALFIGYGLHDPDFQLVLENVLGGRDDTPPHYMLASDATPDYEKQILESSYGVTLIPFSAGDFVDALGKFCALADLVSTTPPALG